MEHRLLHRFPQFEQSFDNVGGRVSQIAALPKGMSMPEAMIEETEAEVAEKLRKRLNGETTPSEN